MVATTKDSNGRVGSVLLCLFAFMATGLMLSVFVGQLIASYSDLNESVTLLLISIVQNIFAFILPTIMAIRIFATNCVHFLQLDTKINNLFFIEVIVLMLLMMPLMDWLIHWNLSISLPKSWHSIEVWMRQQEDLAQSTTQMLLGFTGVGGLVIMIFAIGIITGIGEECFFRGGLQRILQSRTNPHLAIWIAAITFSAIHFQFFGFIPRMVLGAFFGYLYFWSKSLWIPIFGHTLNNSIVVWQTWNSNGNEALNNQVYGTDIKWVLFSLVLTICGLYLFQKHAKSFTKSQENHHSNNMEEQDNNI